MASRLKTLLLGLMFLFCGLVLPAQAQLATFSYNTLTAGPITFNLGNGVSGTVTFTGTVGSGLYNPTTVGNVQTSTFVVVAPGAIGTLHFNVPVTRLVIQSGTGVAGARTDRFVSNRTTVINQQTNVNTSSATIANRTFAPATPLVSLNFSSTSASPFRLGIRTTSTAQPAPLDPIGATMFGNLVAIGAIMLYRRRRHSTGVTPAGRFAMI